MSSVLLDNLLCHIPICLLISNELALYRKTLTMLSKHICGTILLNLYCNKMSASMTLIRFSAVSRLIDIRLLQSTTIGQSQYLLNTCIVL